MTARSRNGGYNFCSNCGREYPLYSTIAQAQRLECFNCGWVVERNPKAIVALLIPVADGLLGIERGGEVEGAGGLSLVGGLLDIETWKTGAVRLGLEGTGLVLRAHHVAEYAFISPTDGKSLHVFGLYMGRLMCLPPFAPNGQVRRLFLIDRPMALCEETHTEAVRRWFAKRDGLAVATP